MTNIHYEILLEEMIKENSLDMVNAFHENFLNIAITI